MEDFDGITPGARFLSATGRIWTIRAITPSGTRVELTSIEPDGEHGIVLDVVAVARLVRIDQDAPDPTYDVEHVKTPVPEAEPRPLGVRGSTAA